MLWHFKNVRTAIMLIGSLALCTFGTGVALNAMHLDFSMTAVLGVVSLLGIMVRNGIIMIDYAEELKKNEHCDAQTAIFNSALRRMRPIFLTSAAASVGVIPMILGGSTLWMPMGGVIFIGTLITMCFILTVLPVLYWKVSGVRVRQRKSV
nr:efflux RND transporter permease subunit [Fibrobacter sp. UWT3]